MFSPSNSRFLPLSLHELGIVVLIAVALPFPLDVLHHQHDDGEGIESEHEKNVEVGVPVIPNQFFVIL